MIALKRLLNMPRPISAAFASLPCLLAAALPLGAQVVPPPAGDDEVVTLEKMEVRADDGDDDYDATGMGYVDAELHDELFSNDLVWGANLDDDPAVTELDAELVQVSGASAVDLATGDSRLSLRGFPTPRLRNGFFQTGLPETLASGKLVTIQGALIPVLGRAAPGGIHNRLTERPRAKEQRRLTASVSSLDRQNVSWEQTGPGKANHLWDRLVLSWQRREGPEQFAEQETRTVNGALTWKHSSTASTLFSFDFQQVSATAAPGIPLYKLASDQKVIGPYLPLAGFNAFGPETGVRRRSANANVQFENQLKPGLNLRVSVDGWWRTVEQDRFTTSYLVLETGRFEGTREPRHIEQPQQVMAAHVELSRRFAALGADHKLLAAVGRTWGAYERMERALPAAARKALPEDVRNFDPAAPNFHRPPFDPSVYGRIIVDRTENANYTAIELSDRAALRKGLIVLTAGLRQDLVSLRLDDRKPGAALPRVRDRVDQTSWHLGANYQAVPGRLLLFASASTAFEPSTRVDARTGRIQGNDTTLGYETGLKGRFFARRLEVSAAAFTLFNRDISRRNPLYEDPIADADHTQPQLVAAGEERFTGGKLDAVFRPSEQWTMSLRGSRVRAITTASPDLPQEVGRPLARLPAYTVSATGRYSFPDGLFKGLSLTTSWNYLSGFVANYEDEKRQELTYPGYGIVGLSTDYTWKHARYAHTLSAGARNLFDRDLLTTQARVGAGRELTASYRLMF